MSLVGKKVVCVKRMSERVQKGLTGVCLDDCGPEDFDVFTVKFDKCLEFPGCVCEDEDILECRCITFKPNSIKSYFKEI